MDNKDFQLDEIVPCQDGMMILKEYYYSEILDDLTRVDVERYDIRVEWVVKEFDEAIDIPICEDAKRWKNGIYVE